MRGGVWFIPTLGKVGSEEDIIPNFQDIENQIEGTSSLPHVVAEWEEQRSSKGLVGIIAFGAPGGF